MWRRSGKKEVSIKEATLEAEFYLTRAEEVRLLVIRVLENNAFLCKKKGITFERQRIEMKSVGWRMDMRTLSRYRTSEKFNISLLQLHCIAWYWNMSVIDLLSRDFAKSEEISGVDEDLVRIAMNGGTMK
jgi:hypothetical protein